ncbi:MAG: type II secretion system protein [Iodobacter sp.]
MKHNKYPSRHTGFTLVELAIVLVIIGLILGMAFKGKDLIDGAKVKSADAGVNKIVSAMNIYFERYGAYPGDGCTAVAPAVPAAFVPCPVAGRDGSLNGANEAPSAVPLMQNAGLLSASDVRTSFGTTWSIMQGPAGTNPVPGRSYLTSAAGAATNDERLVCAMDQQFDDGVNNSGTIRSSFAYTNATDCWNLTGNTATLFVQVLP